MKYKVGDRFKSQIGNIVRTIVDVIPGVNDGGHTIYVLSDGTPWSKKELETVWRPYSEEPENGSTIEELILDQVKRQQKKIRQLKKTVKNCRGTISIQSDMLANAGYLDSIIDARFRSIHGAAIELRKELVKGDKKDLILVDAILKHIYHESDQEAEDEPK